MHLSRSKAVGASLSRPASTDGYGACASQAAIQPPRVQPALRIEQQLQALHDAEIAAAVGPQFDRGAHLVARPFDDASPLHCGGREHPFAYPCPPLESEVG